jgi:hypothetical protein
VVQVPICCECTDQVHRFIGAFEKATTPEEILSSLHQAVVEVMTLEKSTSPSLADLGKATTYTPDTWFCISSTRLELEGSGNGILARYQDGGKESILDGIKGSVARSQAPPTAVIDAEIESADGFILKRQSELPVGDAQRVASAASGAPAASSNTAASPAPTPPAARLDSEGEAAFGSEDFLVEDRGGDGDVVFGDDVVVQKRKSYAVTSSDFLSLPLDSLGLRFAVSASLRCPWFC